MELKYDKIIFACNNDDCCVEYDHILVRAGGCYSLEETAPDCAICGTIMTFCERIEEAGEL